MTRDGSHSHQAGDDRGAHTHSYGVLSDLTITELCPSGDNVERMIDPFNARENLRGSSYDLTVGSEYYVFKGKDRITGRPSISNLGEEEPLTIPPHGICYIISEETLKLPRNIAASLSLRFGLIKQGIMLASQPPIDPTYGGKIVAMLFNLSDKPVSLERRERFLSVEFRFLDKPAEQTYGELHGKYKIRRLKDFVEEPVQGALEKLHKTFNRWDKWFTRVVPIIIGGLTLIIAVLTVLVAILLGSKALNSSKSTQPEKQAEVVSQEVEVKAVLELGNTDRLEETKQDTTASQESNEGKNE